MNMKESLKIIDTFLIGRMIEQCVEIVKLWPDDEIDPGLTEDGLLMGASIKYNTHLNIIFYNEDYDRYFYANPDTNEGFAITDYDEISYIEEYTDFKTPYWGS